MSLIDTRFQVDESKCVGCGLCQLACPSMLIEMNEHKKPSLKPVKSMDWYGCWGCQHCLTVCPNGAISVLGKKPENSHRSGASGLQPSFLPSLQRRKCGSGTFK